MHAPPRTPARDEPGGGKPNGPANERRVRGHRRKERQRALNGSGPEGGPTPTGRSQSLMRQELTNGEDYGRQARPSTQEAPALLQADAHRPRRRLADSASLQQDPRDAGLLHA